MLVPGVFGGEDTHADANVAAALDPNGAVLGVESCPVNEAATHAALSGSAKTTPKRPDRAVQQMRVFMVARRSTWIQRSQALNPLRQVDIYGPDEGRSWCNDRYRTGVVFEATAMRSADMPR